MFEYGTQRRDPIPIAIYCGAGALGIVSGLYPHLLIGYTAEAYLLTCVIFVFIPFEFQRQYVKESWFWKIMLGAGALIHLPLLIGLWFLDSRYPRLVEGALPIFLTGAMLLPPEIAIFQRIVARFRPDGAPSLPADQT
jgi:hypothetical protein